MSDTDKPNGTAARDDGAGSDARIDGRGVGCHKRVTLDDGRYGFCILPAGHEKPRKDEAGNPLPPLADTCMAHVSAPPPPSSFAPRRR